jgi:hypothetical protein
MNFKSVLALCALALVGANAADPTESAKYCYQNKGTFVDSRGIPDDDRFACVLPHKPGDENNGYCLTYNDVYECYTPGYGNMDYCDRHSSEFHNRGCGLGLGALLDHAYMDNKKHQESRDYCYKQKGSMFFEGFEGSPIDFRYACLLPYKEGDGNTKNCGSFGGHHVCYIPEHGNMPYCDRKSKYFNSRGCALGLGALYNVMVSADKRHNSSRTACLNKGGLFLENKTERRDRRYSCFLPERRNNTFCNSIDDFSGCYAKEYSNMNVCDKSTPEYNIKGCALGLGYLDQIKN